MSTHLHQTLAAAAQTAALLFTLPALGQTAPAAQLEAAADTRALASQVQVDLRGLHVRVRITQTTAHATGRGLIVTEADSLLERSGDAYRIALPATAAALPPHSFTVEDGELAFLVIVPDAQAAGRAAVELRPDARPATQLDLGEIDEGARIAFLIPLRDRATSMALARGAVEFEAQADGRSLWSTLPLAMPAATVALAAD
jgi:hypothetical protein